MASVKKVLKQLPENLLPESNSALTEDGDIEEFVKKVISNRVGKKLDLDVGKELGKTFSLVKLKVKPEVSEEQKQQKRRGKRKIGLANEHRRACRLHVLPKKGLKFKDFDAVNAMWCDYFKGMLGSSLQNFGSLGDLPTKRMEEISTNICKADLVGAYLTVTRAKDVGSIGTEGYVAVETKNVFQILGKDNRIRMIPKKSSEFVIELDDYRFKFLGKYFCLRPSERSARKLRIPIFDDL